MKKIGLLAKSFLLLSLAAGSITVQSSHLAYADESAASVSPAPATLTLLQEKGFIRSLVGFEAAGLDPNEDVELVWMTVTGSYKLKGIYSFIGAEYKEQEVSLLKGTPNEDGTWKGSFKVPEGFGGDHTVYVRQNGRNLSQNNYFVSPSFKMSPQSGPVGTEITIEAEGIGWTTMESNWQLTYDNKMTGLISAVSTNGKATAKLRAAGSPGIHSLTAWHGYIGMPYINHQQAPTSYLPVPTFSFKVTEGKPDLNAYVEPVPDSAANGGLIMPDPQNQEGVNVSLSKEAGTVGEPITLTAKGLPANEKLKLVWNTMSGSRVSGLGFAEKQITLVEKTTDQDGSLTFDFPIPDDLGGVPHRIDLVAGEQTYGQTYLTINPSIVSISPVSGPAGTEVTIHLKGVGWTEFDNTLYLTYDNAYTGYMCGFNTQGDVEFTMVATGEPGYHIIDLYPGIYKGQQKTPDVYLAPQLTYEKDHPGSKIPAIRMAFEIKE
ncbi:hypothetical protein [Paenibacillus cremeus]|uniref:Uncharacterized protein n=1 Tax=Paenibacillus cremeus TaxID=2163881 RepID=A0A559KAQ1_9BACL|nr:hypothetical protein [Paenibacillus cremeus]TVY09211.1 hypothetical protein FPZ49_14830 [Paenibacillus cremeus]